MLGLVATVGNDAAGPLADAAAADTFWQKLPRSDPIAAQKALSEALAGALASDNPGIDQLRVLLQLDREAQTLVDALLVNYVAGDAETPVLERAYWQAAFELCQSFGRTYGHFLRSVRERQHYRRWREHLPSMLQRLLQHRQTELLLRPFVDERLTRFSWREVHEVYEYAGAHALLHPSVAITRFRAKHDAESSLEREYIHLLLQGLLNGGHYSPHDGFWVAQRLPHWCETLTLQPHQVQGGNGQLVVDLNSDAGLVRWSVASAATRLCLDIGPALASIGDEITSLRDSQETGAHRSAAQRSRQVRLLRKVKVLFAPQPPLIARRGERKPVGATVEILIGLGPVVCALRRRPPAMSAGAPSVAPASQQSTFTAFGGLTAARTTGSFGEGNSVSPLTAGDLDVGSPLWRLVDRSDSGCRLQGQVFDANWVISGTLIAFRESAAAPWTLAVVRRVEKQADNRADIGVEFMGRNPRGVKISIAAASGERYGGPPDSERPSFAGLFLPESAAQPVLPVKTLVLPAHGYARNDRLTLRSVTALYTIELKDPIEEQGTFIWSPFDIIDRRSRDTTAEPESATVR